MFKKTTSPTLKNKMQIMWRKKVKVKRSLSKKPIKLVHPPQQKKHATCETQQKKHHMQNEKWKTQDEMQLIFNLGANFSFVTHFFYFNKIRCKFQFSHMFFYFNKITLWVSKVTINFYLIEG